MTPWLFLRPLLALYFEPLRKAALVWIRKRAAARRDRHVRQLPSIPVEMKPPPVGAKPPGTSPDPADRGLPHPPAPYDEDPGDIRQEALAALAICLAYQRMQPPDRALELYRALLVVDGGDDQALLEEARVAFLRAPEAARVRLRAIANLFQ
jgi:hypothetical protein